MPQRIGGATLCFRQLALAICSFAAAGCAQSTASSPSESAPGVFQVPGRTEFKSDTTERVGPGLSVRVVESVDLPIEYVTEISDFYAGTGFARLSGGGCIWFVRAEPVDDKPGTDLVAARVARDGAICENVRPDERGVSAKPCSRDAASSILAGWRLTCKQLANGRSALVAVDHEAGIERPDVTLVTLDQQLLFFDVFGIHPHIAEVRTLGVRSDGRTVYTRYMWFAPSTGE